MWRIWLELSPWLLLGACAAGLLKAGLPAGFLRRRLTGRQGVASAVLLGVPLPLCSCAVIPTGLGLKKQGASDGATVGFLISTPQTGVDSVLVTSAMLGLPFALFKVACAAGTGLLGGWLADRASTPSLPIMTTTPPERADRHRWREARDHVLELLRSIWMWIVVGVVLSAFISAWLPTGQLSALSDYGGLPGMLAALVLSLPLYVCATASVPIATSLVQAGLPAGAAIVFLMAGPATNVATLGAVYRTLGAKVLAIYLGTIIAGSMVGGLLFGWLIDRTTISLASHSHLHLASGWVAASGLFLAALFTWFAVDDLRRWLIRPSKDNAAVSVDVAGMTCGGCVAKLESALRADPRVTSALVTLDPGRASATGEITYQRLCDLVREAGFDPAEHQS